MADAAVDIPNRALFKAAEVCEIASVQPYVLRSWESEFPDLGVTKAAGGPRVYRRVDLERVLRIKQLVFVEGLTLAGARRRIEEHVAPPVDEAPFEELLGKNARERLTEVKRGLLAILELLSNGRRPGVTEYALMPPPAATRKRPPTVRARGGGATARSTTRKKPAAGRAGASGRR